MSFTDRNRRERFGFAVNCVEKITLTFLAFLLLSVFLHAQSGKFDGPAELPRAYVRSALSDTPAPGNVITLHPGDDLQAAINRAACGDRIELQAGATFHGNFRFPKKPCDDAHWILLRTSAPDTSLPTEGTRLKPCFAGVASLPGRPDFHCASTQNVMAKIEFVVRGGNGPLIFLSGANHYRFIGLEITRAPGHKVTALASGDDGSPPVDHLIFDRVWMHGDPVAETTRGVALTGMSNIAIVDSFFTDFHCTSGTGACTDAQTISGGGGDHPSGTFKIVNNFLESSGENIILGGSPATMTPTDIEIRGNHLFKPLIWKPGEPGFVGGEGGKPFIVKNLFELKNAQRVLFESNVLENCWGGFSQRGYAILLTPKSQSGHCPLCKVTDVTVRYSLILNVGAVFQITNGTDVPGAFASAGEHYSIHDVVAANVREDHDGAGLFAQLIAYDLPVRYVRIAHTTAFVPRAGFAISNTNKFDHFEFENNLLSTGRAGVVTSGGGQQNCAERGGQRSLSGGLDPGFVIGNCFANSSFDHNLMIGDGGWPKGNISVKDAQSAGIRETGRAERPFSLCTSKEDGCKKASPALHAANDGKNIGADMEKLDQMLANVW